MVVAFVVHGLTVEVVSAEGIGFNASDPITTTKPVSIANPAINLYLSSFPSILLTMAGELITRQETATKSINKSTICLYIKGKTDFHSHVLRASLGDFSASWRALQIAKLEQIRLINVFYRCALNRSGSGHSFHTNRPAVIMLYYGS
jgi:hypothetical protein